MSKSSHPVEGCALFDVARLSALRRLKLLDSEEELGFDRLTRLAARIVKAPVCLVSLVDDRRQFFKSAVGLGGPVGEARQTPLTHSFCQHVVNSGAPLVVEDALQNPLVRENLAVRDLGVIAYLGMPIRSPEGHVLGSFCVIDTKPRTWRAEDIEMVRDLAALVDTEISLRVSLIEKDEALLRQAAVLDSTRFSVIATSPEGTIELFNAGAERMLGYSADEMVGRHTPGIVHVAEEVVARASELSVELGREIPAGFEAFVAHACIHGVDEREWTYVRKDGSRLPVLLSVTALRDTAGEIVGFLGVGHDISMRQQADALRREDSERLGKLGAQVPGVIYQFRLRPDGRTSFPYASEGIRQIYRVSPEEVREDASKAFEIVHPDDVERISHSIAESARTLETWHCEFRVRYPDGEERWLLGNSVPEREADGCVLWHGFITDITEKKRAEKALQEGEERFRQAFEFAGIGMAIVGLDGRWLRVNQSICDIVGYPAEELMRKTFQDITHPDDLNKDLAYLRELLEGKRRVYQMEKRYFHRAGHVVNIRLTASLVRDEAGAPLHFIAQIEDVTRRNQLVQALRESEERVRMATAVAEVGVWDLDLNLNRVRWDGQMFVLYGMVPTTDGVVDYSAWARSLAPDELERQEAMLQNTVAERGRSQREFRIRRYSDGSERIIQASEVVICDTAGVPMRMVGVNRDVTEWRQAETILRDSEERVRLFAEHAPASVAMFDRDMRYLVVSKQWIADYKLEEAPLIGRSHYEVFPEIPERWKQIHRDCLAGAVSVSEAELFERADGSRQWLRFEVRPWHRQDGEIGGIVMFTQDITAQRELQESLAGARDQALEASRLKSEFLATMSHEIRTPMNAVIGMAGLLADTALDEDQSDMLRTMVGGAENLLTIINDILDFSRIEAGRMRLDPAEFDFSRVIEETVALLASRAHEKNIELLCEFESALDFFVLGDAGRVRQVVTNLIGNAIKFTDTGEVRVGTRIISQTDKRVRVRVNVHDTGVGIPQEAQGRLFQAFTQVDGSTTRRFGGTGLGLAISRQLVDLMGGEIGFESQPGVGSVFWVEFEFDRQGGAVGAAPVELPPGRRVLVVDDNRTNRRILVSQLERWDLEVAAVPDAKSALEALQAGTGKSWDLVLLDWHMPGMDGVELAGAIHGIPALAHIPLVMLSSGGMRAESDAVADRFSAFLTKPVTAQQLNRCISRVFSEAATAPVVAEKPVVPVVEERVKRRLLLAEDNVGNQKVASIMLGRMGYLVDIAQNGDEALTQLAARPYDLVLMDCQMPVLDGYEAARRIRSGALAGVDARVPIIALTAYARPEDRLRCMHAGMDDYVTKPIRVSELRAALERCGLAGKPGRSGVPAGEPAGEQEEGDIFDEDALGSLEGLAGGDGTPLVAELAGMYLRDEQQALSRLADLASARQPEQLGNAAHGFGGNAASFGGLQVRKTALELEQAARQGNWPDVSRQLARLRHACKRLREEIGRRNLLNK